MERFYSPKVMAYAVALFALIMASSCVNEEYDMSKDNLDLEVTPFQDGLVLPLGSTDTLKLRELLKDMDADVLKTLENGTYAVSYGDSFDMSEELSSLSDMIKIDDVVFSKDVNFRLNAADVSKVKVDEMDYSFDYDISSDFKAPDIVLPSVGENLEIAAGLADYAPAESQLQLSSFPSVDHETHFMSISEEFTIPSFMINDDPIAIDGALLGDYLITDPEFDGTETIHMNIDLPKGVASVEDIILHEGAKMRVSLELRNSFLVSGKLIPEIDVDLHEIFHLDAAHSTDHVNLQEDFVLSEKNGYKQTVTYNITSLAISKDDWKRKDADSPCVLDKDFVVPAKGKIHFEDLMTTTRMIANNRNIDIYMKLEFIDLQIDDIKMKIDPVTVSEEKEVALEMDEFKLPEEVEEIRNISFTSESGFDIRIDAKNMNKVGGLDLILEKLVITFPDEVRLEGANSRNEVVFTDVDLSRGFDEHVSLLGLDMPDPVGGKVVFSDNIRISAVAKASGTIHSADLPKTEADDVKVTVNVNADIEVADYEVSVKGFEYNIEPAAEVISVPLPEEMLELGEINVTPAGNPAVLIDIEMPDVDLDLVPSADGGICLSFPEMFRFKTPLPAEYNYRASDNSISLNGNILDKIELPIEELVLVPELDETDGKVYAKGEFKLSGGLVVETTVMNKEQIEDITSPGKSVKINAHVPELVPSGVDFDNFQTRISEKVDLNLMSAEDMPEEIVSIGRIELADVFLNVSLDASGLPELGSTELSLDFTVDLPEMVEVSGVETDEEGNLKLTGKMNDKGIVEVDPVRIDALNLSGYDMKEGIKDVIALDGFVKFSEASLDVDEWLGKDLNVTFKADIKDIEIAKITGKVDYQVDPVVEAIDLSDFADAIGGEDMDMELDFNHAHLALAVSTNLGVPVSADVELVPYYNGTADEDKVIPVSLDLDPAKTADQMTTARFWLANPGSESRCPEEYEFVEADIVGLIRNLPEKLEFRMNAGTDPERECVLEPSAKYELKADYSFELPLEFGEKFNITFKDTIQGLPDIFGQLVSKGKIKLAGDITSSLPLGLDLTLNLLDSDGGSVPMADGCGQLCISPCNHDGSAVKTGLDLMLGLKDGVDVSDITSIELLFKATSAGAAGVPLTEDSFLHANLQLVLPEGVTVDLEEMMANDEQ